jgi:hypothetical protein
LVAELKMDPIPAAVVVGAAGVDAGVVEAPPNKDPPAAGFEAAAFPKSDVVGAVEVVAVAGFAPNKPPVPPAVVEADPNKPPVPPAVVEVDPNKPPVPPAVVAADPNAPPPSAPDLKRPPALGVVVAAGDAVDPPPKREAPVPNVPDDDGAEPNNDLVGAAVELPPLLENIVS